MAPERISSELFVPGPHRSILNSPFEPREETAESHLAGLCWGSMDWDWDGASGSWGCAECGDIMGCVVSPQNLLHRHQFPSGGSVPSQHRREGEPQLLLRAGKDSGTGEENLGNLGGKFGGFGRKLLSWWMPGYRSALLSLKLIFWWIGHVVNELFCIKTRSCLLWAPTVFSSFSPRPWDLGPSGIQWSWSIDVPWVKNKSLYLTLLL